MVLSPLMDYVGEPATQVVKYIEKKFQSVHEAAGILFVSVSAVPAPEGKVTDYVIRLGISKKFEEGTGMALVKSVLNDEIERKAFNISVAIYRGVSGAASDQGDEGPHPRPA